MVAIFSVDQGIAYDNSDEFKAISKVELLGGKVRREDNLPGRPVMEVIFQGSQSDKLNDKYLHVLKAFSSLTTLNLGGTRISDVGLNQIGELKSLRMVILSNTANA